MGYSIIKRLFDFLFALILIVISLPLIILTALFIAITIDRKVIFSQTRVGLNKKHFKIFKFRTMVDLFDENGNLLPDNMRMTKCGDLVRKFSLDELPQLINVLKGEMSFVGPRPLLVEYLPFYTKKEQMRHNVLPGITGWAQVNGRNSIAWDLKLGYDVFYVENISFWLDCKILFMTISKVLKGSDINADKNITMPRLSEIREKQQDGTN